MRLPYDMLPVEIKSCHEKASVHKIEKKGSSTIVIHLRTQIKEVWRRLGSLWSHNGSTNEAEDAAANTAINTPRIL